MGVFTADIIVENTVIVELKSIKRLIEAHEVQLVNYLVATNKPVGLLLNFGERKVEVNKESKGFESFDKQEKIIRFILLSCLIF